jgi:hypothetical protein
MVGGGGGETGSLVGNPPSTSIRKTREMGISCAVSLSMVSR